MSILYKTVKMFVKKRESKIYQVSIRVRYLINTFVRQLTKLRHASEILSVSVSSMVRFQKRRESNSEINIRTEDAPEYIQT